jgi:hypothetical protein
MSAHEDLTLVQQIAKARVMHSFLPDDDDRSKNEYVADELVEAGWIQRGPFTDAQVEAAVVALWTAYDEDPVIEAGDYAPMRAALEAAREAS